MVNKMIENIYKVVAYYYDEDSIIIDSEYVIINNLKTATQLYNENVKLINYMIYNSVKKGKYGACFLFLAKVFKNGLLAHEASYDKELLVPQYIKHKTFSDVKEEECS